MAKPVVSDVANELYDILSPLAFADESNGWPLLHFCEALIGAVQLVNDYSENAWANLLDIDKTTDEALPWLAQFVGVVLLPQLSTESSADFSTRIRAYIKSTPGFTRGSKAAMIAEIQQHLTGEKVVIFRERYGGAYKLEIRTYTSQTPDSARVLKAILSQKPAGIVLDYITVTGQDWQQLFTNYVTWQNVFTTYPTWQDVVEDTP